MDEIQWGMFPLQPKAYVSLGTVTFTGGKGSINWGIHADYIVVF